MRLTKIYSLLLILLLALGSCEELLDPLDDNHLASGSFNRVLTDADYAEGLLITAYARIPTNSFTGSWISVEVASDDAVSSNKLNNYRRMATGQWSALNNPINQWDNCNSGILYVNKFLTIVDSVNWKWTNPEMRKLLTQRFKGEAYALRGLLKYHLLVTVGGENSSGQMLGIPIYDKFIETQDEFNTPRATFAESIASIYTDLDKALSYIVVDDYQDVSNLADLSAGFSWVTDLANYNTVYGKLTLQRISGRIVKALKARVALLAASPAYSTGSATLWADAANYAGAVLNTIGGVAGIDPVGHKWYLASYIDGLKLTTDGLDQPEMIWRRPREVTNSRESANFPPSLYGQGGINPTQNLIDAFPTASGYPIGHASSGYSATHPYNSRDPRLALYIIYNGSTYKSKVINTGIGGGTNAKDSIETSTRTGYYLKKLLREDVNMTPNSTSTKNHYEVHMRYTELFLIYAEAANEAWGPDGTGGTYTFTARDVVAAIRERAGITQPDDYLASISNKDDMRTLIRNERRLELCFEGFRFWDLRRWNLDLTEPAKGVEINKAGTTFNIVEVEERAYDNSYMHHGPLPQNEILKFSALIQNKGW